ncbi:MAG: S24 family peptidase [Bacteroidota bacterium]
MSRKHLTSKQHAFYQFLINHVREHGVWPTYREIGDHFGYRSPNSVTQNMQALHRKAYLRRRPDGSYTFADASVLKPHPSAIPVRGTITAGVLQEAIDADLGMITLETLFPNLDRLFAIRVAGWSMRDAGIRDGDYVLLIDDDIPNGGIGAVLYNGETTLKHIYHDEKGLRLVPANEEYETIQIKPEVFEEVRVVGRYVGRVTDEGIFRHTPTQFRPAA